MNKKKFSLTMLFLIFFSYSHAGPISKYYMVSWQNQGMQVIQGNSVIQSWASGGLNELPVVVDGTIKTYAYYQNGSYGKEYTLDGVATGTNYSIMNTDLYCIDATTDGNYIYTTGNNTQKVYRFNKDWTNPQLIFTVSEVGRILGITYDPTDNTLWFSGYDNNTMSHYDLNGNILGTFTVADNHTGGLALDHADGTLWYYGYDSHQLHQYSKSGTLLQRSDITGLGTRLWGGEFDYSIVVPEPSNFICIFLGLCIVQIILNRKQS
jgi:hypothetical protein